MMYDSVQDPKDCGVKIEQNELISKIMCERTDLITEDSENTLRQTLIKYPELTVKIGKLSINAMIDTGSNITCINQEWFHENKIKLGKIEELPLTGINVTTATGHTVKRINKIIMLQVMIKDISYNIQCLVIPKLVKEIIIGTDTMQDLNMIINWKEKNIKIEYEGKSQMIRFNDTKDNSTNYDLNLVINNECYEEMINTETNDAEACTNLSNDQQIELNKLVDKYKTIFSKKPGICKTYNHKIRVSENKPYIQRSYPIPIRYQKAIQIEIEKMLAEGIIERSNSSYINPIVPVIKKNGDVRLCLDMRQLNRIIIPDYDCNLSINELLCKSRNTRWMSTIDLTNSFWQIKLEQNSRKYTAFQHQGKTYHFTVVPYGLSTSSAALVRALDTIFRDEINDFLLLYVDDMLCQSDSFEEHMKHLEQIFKKFSDSGMTINFEKSSFCRKEVTFLGFKLSEKGIEQNYEKTKVILDFPTPKNHKQVKAFLGMTNFYNKFVEKYSDLIHPLLHLTSKRTKFIWTEKEDIAFKNIKEAFLKTNYLAFPDPNKEFILQTDASHNCIGGNLYQLKDNGDKGAVMFMSRTLKGSELNYCTTEKELLAILFCLQKARPLILGAKLKIVTDHQALTFMRKCRLLNSRLTRWILSIQEYNFEIEHCKGTENIVADTISRYSQNNEKSSPEIVIALIKRDEMGLKSQLNNIATLQQRDEKIRKILDNIETHNGRYKIEQGILFKKM